MNLAVKLYFAGTCFDYLVISGIASNLCFQITRDSRMAHLLPTGVKVPKHSSDKSMRLCGGFHGFCS